MPWEKHTPRRTLAIECVIRLNQCEMTFGAALQRKLKQLRFDRFDVLIDRKRRMIGFKRAPTGLYRLPDRREFSISSKQLFSELQAGTERVMLPVQFDSEGVDFFITLPPVEES